MAEIQLYEIGMEYPEGSEVSFQRPPTMASGGFEIIQGSTAINCIVNVIWRPQLSIFNGHRPTFSITKYFKGVLHTKLPHNPNECAPKSKEPNEALKHYCERIYRNIQKEQGKITILNRQETKINGHKADLSEFTFPIHKRGNSGDIRRLQIIFCCENSSRLIAVYGSTLMNANERYFELIREMLSTIKCH